LEGFELTGRPLGRATAAEELKFAECEALKRAACMGGELEREAAKDAFKCYAESGYGSYPLVFFPFRTASGSQSVAGMDMQAGALNGEAWCHVTPAVTDPTFASEKGIIHGYNIDLAGTQNLQGFSYDYFVRGCTPTDTPCGDQFYLNMYFRNPGSTAFNDCRLDFVPLDANGVPGSKYTFSIDLDTVATTASAGCGPNNTLRKVYQADLVLESSACYIFALNIGDTTLRSELAGCYDNIQLTTTTGTETYDLQSNAV
jgi:hypothetical protein